MRANETRLVLWDDRIVASLSQLAAAEAVCTNRRDAADRFLCLARQRHGSSFAGRHRTSPLDGLVMFFDSRRQLHLGTDLTRAMRFNLVGRPGRRELFLQLRIKLQ